MLNTLIVSAQHDGLNKERCLNNCIHFCTLSRISYPVSRIPYLVSRIPHSFLKLFTGFINDALIAW